MYNFQLIILFSNFCIDNRIFICYLCTIYYFCNFRLIRIELQKFHSTNNFY